MNYAPFPYLVTKLDDDLYEELQRNRPGDDWVINGRQVCPNQRVDRCALDSLGQLPEPWERFVRSTTSQMFWDEVLLEFSYAVRAFYPGIEWGPVGVRGSTKDRKARVWVDSQIGINTPGPGRIRGPHLDNPVELFGGMLYMNGGGAFEIYRFIDQPQFHGKLEVDDDCVELVDSVPCEPNTMVLFLNTPFSVHGVSEYTGRREFVNLAAEMNEPLFRIAHGRY